MFCSPFGVYNTTKSVRSDMSRGAHTRYVAVDVLSSVVPTKRKCLDTNYAMVVSRRAKISPCTLMMGILYSERLRQKNPEYLRRVSSSDLFLISMMVASKYLYDEGEDEEVFNDDWAKAGSKTVNDVNKLEMEFLASIDWSLFISNQEFLDFVNKVESRVATTHGLCRGWFTYGDLSTLLDNSGFLRTLGIFRLEVLKVLCACALTYVLSLSLALSLTSIASHHCQHTHQNFTPVQTPPCLTTETACRFHRPAVTHQRGKYEASVAAKRDRGTRNESRPSLQTRTALTEQEQALQPVDIEGRLVPEKNNSDSPLSCKWRPSPYRSKMAVHKSGNTIKQLKTRGDSSSLIALSSLVFSEILSRRLVFHHPCPSTSVLNSFTTDRVQKDFVFSNFSHGMRNNDWYRGHTNGSYICVA
ncbi:hypothetical protein ACROYT_G034522 [Oculina patagonica]